MAGSISESFDNLRAQINRLASSFRALGAGIEGRARLESSPNFEKAVSLVGNNAFLTNAYNIQNKAKDIQRAQRAMRSHPGRWNTPDEYLAYEREQKERGDRLVLRLRELRKERFDRQQRLLDKILSIKSPKRYREMMLSREYGDTGASQIIAAEQDKEQQERRDTLAKRERELRKERFDRQQEVSDKIMSIKSPDRYRKMMLSRKYGTSNADAIIAAEDTEEQRLRDSRRSIGVRRRQVEAYSKFPWVKTLVDAGLIQKKELPKITKMLTRASKVPGFGMMVRHPVVASLGMAAAGLAVIDSSLKRQDKANKTVTNWEASEAVFGKPSKAFESAMMKAGMSYQDVLNAWAKMSMKYGDPDSALPMLGAKLSGIKPGIERGIAAEAMWLDQKMATGAMIAAGEYTPSKAAEVNARIAELDKMSDEYWKSGTSIGQKARAVGLSVLGEKELEARGVSWIDVIKELMLPGRHAMTNEPYHADELKAWDEAQEAARSAEEYDRSKVTAQPSVDGSEAPAGNQVTLNVNEIRILDAKDVPSLIQSIASEAGLGYNIDVMNWADSRRVKV